MKVIERDIWLCDDCMLVHETGDASHLDYHYSEPQATHRLANIDAGLERLGPHLVNDNTENDGDQRECRACGHIAKAEDFPVKLQRDDPDDEEEEVHECPVCRFCDTEERDSGRLEFSNKGCDCCGSMLAGSLSRYAVLGD